jgi:hypothetical protein
MKMLIFKADADKFDYRVEIAATIADGIYNPDYINSHTWNSAFNQVLGNIKPIRQRKGCIYRLKANCSNQVVRNLKTLPEIKLVDNL